MTSIAFEDQPPQSPSLTDYDRYPFSQHVSCGAGRVQLVDSLRMSAKRRNETDSDLLAGHDGSRGPQGGSFLTINFECWGQ